MKNFVSLAYFMCGLLDAFAALVTIVMQMTVVGDFLGDASWSQTFRDLAIEVIALVMLLIFSWLLVGALRYRDRTA